MLSCSSKLKAFSTGDCVCGCVECIGDCCQSCGNGVGECCEGLGECCEGDCCLDCDD